MILLLMIQVLNDKEQSIPSEKSSQKVPKKFPQTLIIELIVSENNYSLRSLLVGNTSHKRLKLDLSPMVFIRINIRTKCQQNIFNHKSISSTIPSDVMRLGGVWEDEDMMVMRERDASFLYQKMHQGFLETF